MKRKFFLLTMIITLGLFLTTCPTGADEDNDDNTVSSYDLLPGSNSTGYYPTQADIVTNGTQLQFYVKNQGKITAPATTTRIELYHWCPVKI